MNLAFQSERWADVEEELRPLAERHWQEMPFDLCVPLNISSALYAELDRAGRLDIVTARADGRLVGYFLTFLGKHPHYDLFMGSMDVYYLEPEFRRGTAGLQLFRAMEHSLRRRGVRYVLATARLDREKNAAAVFERLGWHEARTVYEKRLGDSDGIH